MPNVAAARCCGASANCSATRNAVPVEAWAVIAFPRARRRRRAPAPRCGRRTAARRPRALSRSCASAAARGSAIRGRSRARGLAIGARAAEQRPAEIDQRQQVPEREDDGSGRRQHVEGLELGRVVVVAPRHARDAEQVLREEREVEADEQEDGRETRPRLRIHAAGDLRPPEMHAAEVGRHGAADHDVVEMRDDEIGVGEMHVERERGEKQPGHAPDREQADEAERVEHRRAVA